MKRTPIAKRKEGFTLIEILVVLVIASIISSITFGAFRSISEGNRRTSCQSNLSQIYQSCRQYAQDYDNKFPYFNEAVPGTDKTPRGGLGLWSLYTFPKEVTSVPVATTSLNCTRDSVDLPLPSEDPNNARPLTGYLRSVRVFHCPSDNYQKEVSYRDASAPDSCLTQKVDTGVLTFQAGGRTYTNPAYLSYQTADDVPAVVDTYSSFRAPETATAPVRQLVPYVDTPSVALSPRPTRNMTVVTWCRWHRRISSSDLTTQAGRRNYDNVLFSDGSVQNLPAEQNVTETNGTAGTCTGWKRVPRGKADSMASASECIPST